MSIYFAFALVLFTFLPVNGARVLLSLYALDLGAAPLAVGFLTATFSVFPMLLAVLSGKITDRVGARWPVLCGTVLHTQQKGVPDVIPPEMCNWAGKSR